MRFFMRFLCQKRWPFPFTVTVDGTQKKAVAMTTQQELRDRRQHGRFQDGTCVVFNVSTKFAEAGEFVGEEVTSLRSAKQVERFGIFQRCGAIPCVWEI